MKKLILICLLFTILVSCKKENTPTPKKVVNQYGCEGDNCSTPIQNDYVSGTIVDLSIIDNQSTSSLTILTIVVQFPNNIYYKYRLAEPGNIALTLQGFSPGDAFQADSKDYSVLQNSYPQVKIIPTASDSSKADNKINYD